MLLAVPSLMSLRVALTNRLGWHLLDRLAQEKYQLLLESDD